MLTSRPWSASRQIRTAKRLRPSAPQDVLQTVWKLQPVVKTPRHLKLALQLLKPAAEPAALPQLREGGAVLHDIIVHGGLRPDEIHRVMNDVIRVGVRRADRNKIGMPGFHASVADLLEHERGERAAQRHAADTGRMDVGLAVFAGIASLETPRGAPGARQESERLLLLKRVQRSQQAVARVGAGGNAQQGETVEQSVSARRTPASVSACSALASASSQAERPWRC